MCGIPASAFKICRARATNLLFHADNAGMIGRSRAGGGPEEYSISLAYGDVIDACLATAHQAPIFELPQFVAVRPVPQPGVIVPFVLEADRDPPRGKGPEFLDEAVFVLPAPFPSQEFLNLPAADDKFATITPHGVERISKRHVDRIAEFQASSAARTLATAESWVNGGRIGADICRSS